MRDFGVKLRLKMLKILSPIFLSYEIFALFVKQFNKIDKKIKKEQKTTVNTLKN